jgi:glucose/arabinose dehydrogenase
VGESSREEINIVPTSASGRNFGWAIMEGSSCFGGGTSCDRTGLTLPAFEYGRDDGCAVIGGSVYRGSNIPELRGYYFFADLCQRELRAFRYLNNSVDDLRTWTVDGFTSIFSLGTDALGELYLLALSGSSGTLYRIDKVTDA